MGKPVTLFFNSVRISFIGRAEWIVEQNYDFSQFGPVVSGEGENWELVAYGKSAPKRYEFYNEKKDTKNPPSIGCSG